MYVQNGVNYGKLVECVTESGITFYIDEFYLPRIHQPYRVIGPVVKGTNRPIYEHMHVEVGERDSNIYAVERTDVLKLAQYFSEYSSVYSHAVNLAVYRGGNLMGKFNTLDDFYTNITAEELAATALF